jgi:1,2-beta-oligoglucan phosphorylase
VDHAPLSHPERGLVLASRQNQYMGGRNPWCVIGSLGRGVSFATDALQVYGLATRASPTPAAVTHGLPGTCLQHEHSMAAIQDAELRLQPGERTGFDCRTMSDFAIHLTADILGKADSLLSRTRASLAPVKLEKFFLQRPCVARPCGRPPMRARDCAKSCACWD